MSDEEYDAVLKKYDDVDTEKQRLEKTYLAPTEALNAFLAERGLTPVSSGVSLAALIRRPGLDYAALAPFDAERPDLPAAVVKEAEIDLKYAGYIEKQMKQVAEAHRMEERKLPPDTDYAAIAGLRLEARQKLDAVRPENLGQASRISGVSPSDIAVLMVWLGK